MKMKEGSGYAVPVMVLFYFILFFPFYAKAGRKAFRSDFVSRATVWHQSCDKHQNKPGGSSGRLQSREQD